MVNKFPSAISMSSDPTPSLSTKLRSALQSEIWRITRHFDRLALQLSRIVFGLDERPNELLLVDVRQNQATVGKIKISATFRDAVRSPNRHRGLQLKTTDTPPRID